VPLPRSLQTAENATRSVHAVHPMTCAPGWRTEGRHLQLRQL